MNTSRNFDVNRYSFACHSTIITCTGGRDMHAGCILYGHNFVQGAGSCPYPKVTTLYRR
jgi:hypothetical protein